MPRLDPDQIKLQIEAKLARQRILTQANPPAFAVVRDEAALHRLVGGRQVMAEQLAKILDISALYYSSCFTVSSRSASLCEWRRSGRSHGE